MWTKGLIFLIGAFYTYTEISHSPGAVGQDIYVAELMVESNVTLEAETILQILDSIEKLTVTDASGNVHDVIILEVKRVAECLIVGVETSCNCSAGYTWTNEVCYNYNCCRDAEPCNKNVSYITPLCIPKHPVRINGSVTLSSTTWDHTKEDTLTAKFELLNGFQSLNITGEAGALAVEFEVGLYVKFTTEKLQEIINSLETILMAYIPVDTTGLVDIEFPSQKVCYHSTPSLKCTYEEPTDKAGWNMSKTFERFELNNGSVVKLDEVCSTEEFRSCMGVTLEKVTGGWEGTYECGFSKGLVRHTAKAYLSVARLPDSILLEIDPLTGDCSDKDPTGTVTVTVKATIPKTNNTYNYTWRYNGPEDDYQDGGTQTIFTYDVQISCVETQNPHTVAIIFKNDIGQTKTAEVTIPVIYAGKMFCDMDILDGQLWPKTPDGDTVVNHTCSPGRVGYRARTCKKKVWDDVFDYCVNEQLDKISNAAENFLKGLGATEEVANDIFNDLQKNTGSSGSDSDNPADLAASIGVFDMMATASGNIPLGDKILGSVVGAASNMLNKTWSKVNTSVLHDMSANFLESLEGLVENIGINISNGNADYNTNNLEMKTCTESNCSLMNSGIGIKTYHSGGIVKTLVVKNLMDKLRNTFTNSKSCDLIVSVTRQGNSDKKVNIEMTFPATPKCNGNGKKRHCVFWNPDKDDFADKGCWLKDNPADNGTTCECNHLTSFSVLMARGDVSNPVLDVITYVGLGISIVSLVLFLIIEYLVWAAVVKTKLSHYRHTAMVNIALFLLLADICFLASVEPTKLSESMCFALTICKHLFFLAKFCWMFCLSAMLVHQLIFVFNPLRKKVFMYLSSLVGYIVPILIVGSTYIYYKYTNKPYYNPDLCWLTYTSLLVGSLHAFLLPIGTILLSNIFSMGVVIVTLLKSSKNDSSKTDEKDTAKSIIKVILVLAPVFGVTWSIGFCLVVFNPAHPAYEFFNYTFTIVNSFQGLFVLLTGFMAEQKVKEELYRVVTGNKKGSSDSTKNLTSTTYTKDK